MACGRPLLRASRLPPPTNFSKAFQAAERRLRPEPNRLVLSPIYGFRSLRVTIPPPQRCTSWWVLELTAPEAGLPELSSRFLHKAPSAFPLSEGLTGDFLPSKHPSWLLSLTRSESQFSLVLSTQPPVSLTVAEGPSQGPLCLPKEHGSKPEQYERGTTRHRAEYCLTANMPMGIERDGGQGDPKCV